ncbi:hypothetical protein V6Z11_D12G096100 [Gossypium hirsutum]|uniref:Expansin-like EG45 domain-containing protein n=1 Tax=Gossypium tomentosum TaxID=34277 RepID=A0A5D2I7H9_GOSTO|nr:hypothetical protein ES332_D12G087500v1 [Gossypium tomentosum]
MKNYSLFFVSMVTCLVSFASTTSGIATFYTKYDQGKMIVTVGDALWDNGTVCGKMFTMTCTIPRNPIPHQCTGKSLTIKIVDCCPGCPSTIDLSREAFTIITNPVASIINVDYKQYA